MTTLALIADDKAEVINGGFMNSTYFQQNQTATSGNATAGAFALASSSATANQGIAVGNTGTAVVGIGAFRIF